eukprot:266312_1
MSLHLLVTSHTVSAIVSYLGLYMIKGQFIEIWYDDMAVNNGWTLTTPTDVEISARSIYCTQNPCIRITTKNAGHSAIDKGTDISGYTSIQLQFDVTTNDLEDSSDKCQVYYAYDTRNDKVHLQDYTGGIGGEITSFENEIFYLPLSLSSTMLWIFFEVSGTIDHSDYCYWDNVYLRGIPATPTPAPSRVPTHMPSISPISKPTLTPTSMPSSAPTLEPSISPAQSIIARNPTTGDFIISLITTRTPHGHTLTTDFRKPEDNNQSSPTYLVAVYVSSAVILSCAVCVVIACIYYRKINRKEVQVPNANDAFVQRDRVCSESQIAANGDAEEAQDSEPRSIECITVGLSDKALLKEWLTQKVRLSQYYDAFAENGYETLDMVKEITDEEELKAIGITLKGHVLKLMKEIRRLNTFAETVNDNVKASDDEEADNDDDKTDSEDGEGLYVNRHATVGVTTQAGFVEDNKEIVDDHDPALVAFFEEYHLSDIKPKIYSAKLELIHFMYIEKEELEGLCKDLQFDYSQMIRFKLAIKMFQKKVKTDRTDRHVTVEGGVNTDDEIA